MSVEQPAPLSRVGNSNDQTRRYNLSTVLTLLHHGGSRTRAELTRATGLNRSTIAALVGELGDLGLVYETQQTDPGTVGRPSPFVHLTDRLLAVAVNPDLDAITIGLVQLGGRVLTRVRHETSRAPGLEETVSIVQREVAALVAGLAADQHIAGVGIAVPGLVRSSDGVVTLAPHLLWNDQPLAGPIAEALGIPAFAANDAQLGLVAESLFGAGRGVEDIVYLNGSTSGIGGSVLVAGNALRGAQGYAGELGHTLVNSSGVTCFCGKSGCLETEVNLARLLEALGTAPVDGDEFDRMLVAAADDTVRAEIDRQLDVLGTALGNFVSIFNPSSIILGGFLGSLFAANPERLQAGIRRASFGSLGDEVTVERAQLRTRLLMVGAAELAFGPVLADPAGALG
ncbi:ROK family protein [Agreia pratensis]|uniref:Sugar kinase of the NBD/HSP70 family, may contain an N-terminal HTH domain n=1 Tax=Agreia pratensis TaxID=150121 RepID=A0A1X7IIT2_9MICO|nr:ROK family protein [Agreia pratensis]MBF4633150.1 ROK family protein [Agreia pratensis]SMG14501.1 Sugar kinase of the NBD/HSP70 family, may contain an N-terminal HTH domain [Agreia pratensis]